MLSYILKIATPGSWKVHFTIQNKYLSLVNSENRRFNISDGKFFGPKVVSKRFSGQYFEGKISGCLEGIRPRK